MSNNAFNTGLVFKKDTLWQWGNTASSGAELVCLLKWARVWRASLTLLRWMAAAIRIVAGMSHLRSTAPVGLGLQPSAGPMDCEW